MTVKTANGAVIDANSPEYQAYLRLKEWDEKQPDVSDPAPYRTLGDVLELERRRYEREASETPAQKITDKVSA